MADIQRDTTAVATKEPEAENSVLAVIDLPSYDDMTDQKICQSLKKNFDGFDPGNGDMDVRFDTAESMAAYANATMDSIDNLGKEAARHTAVVTGASAARYWCLSRTINAALEKGNYGSNAIDRLADLMHKGRSRVYQIASIGKRLSMVDCYLLGVRGVSRTTMERLAGLSDERLRQVLLKGFIASTTNTDPDVLDKRRSAFNSAVKNGTAALDAANAIEAGTSDPYGDDADSGVSPEYDKLIKLVRKWIGYAKNMAGDVSAEQLHNAMADFYITDSTPDADIYLKTLKEAVAGLEADLLKVLGNLRDLIPEMRSIQNVRVTKHEDAKSEADGDLD